MPDVSSPSPAAGRTTLRQRRWPWWVACGIATIAVIIFFRAFDWREIAADIRRADLRWLAVAILANFATLPIMTQQWRMLLPRDTKVTWREMWECVTLSMASMNTLPFGGGHAVAVGLLSTRKITTVSGALSLLALEQLCEGVSRLALVGVALAGVSLPPVLQKTAWGLAGAVSLGFVALIVIARRPAKSSTGWHARFRRHLEILRRPHLFVPTAALSLVMKACAIFAVYSVQRSMGAEVPLSATPLVLCAVLFATGVAVTPGNVVTYELAAIGAYLLLGLKSHVAAPLGLLLHLCFMIPVIGTGYSLLIWRLMKPAVPVVPRE